MATTEIRGKYLFMKGARGMGSNEEYYVSISGANITLERDDEGNVDSVFVDKGGVTQSIRATEMKPSREEFMTRLMSALGITATTGGRRTRKTH